MAGDRKTIHVSLVAIPDAMLSTLSSIYDVLNCFPLLGTFGDAVPDETPFKVEIVAPALGHTPTASGLPVSPHRTVDEIDETDIVIIPSMMVAGGEWKSGRYPEVVSWLILPSAKASRNSGLSLTSTCRSMRPMCPSGSLTTISSRLVPCGSVTV